VIVVYRVTNDSDYKAYRQGERSYPRSVNCCRRRTSISVENFGTLTSQYRIVLYSGLRWDSIMFDGQIATLQRINLLCDGQHYHIITNLTAAMAKQCLFPACNMGFSIGAQHRCFACSAIPSCIQENDRIPCDECNRHFRNAACFENHKRLKIPGKTCEVKRWCYERTMSVTNGSVRTV